MAIIKLEYQHFRNLVSTRLNPVSGFNYIIGPNASGKTSLLEAIYYLSRANSFRTHLTAHLISQGHCELTVYGEVHDSGRSSHIGISRSKTVSQIRIDGKSAQRTSELVSLLPLTLLETGLHTIIEGGPENRRKFLDWGVFHVEQHYRDNWIRFRRALMQRNAAIKAGWTRKNVAQWDTELVQASDIITDHRRRYLANLAHTVAFISSRFPGLGHIDLSYVQGWKQGLSYAEYLQQQLESDIERGFTQYGPHRADIRISTETGSAKDVLSRGQQKLCMASLIISQCKQLQNTGREVVILVDDLAAELDKENRIALLSALSDSNAQVFISGTDSSIVEEYRISGSKVFHVEQGNVRETGTVE